jgi:hypothetical protein
MNIENLKKKSLNELVDLRNATESVCEDYANLLTSYATMSADPAFQRMPPGTKMAYDRRGKFVKLLNRIKSIIEDKLMEIYDEQD